MIAGSLIERRWIYSARRLPVLGLAILMCSLGSVEAAQPESLFISYPNGGRQLVEIVGSEMAIRPEDAGAYCRAAESASRRVQAAVGAGFAFAHELLSEQGHYDAAEHITTTACSCEEDGELILASYAAARRESAEELCTGATDPGSGPPPTLFYIRSQAGGGAVVIVSPD
jgi:hypothetical protein